jgi:hypothetical protein
MENILSKVFSRIPFFSEDSLRFSKISTFSYRHSYQAEEILWIVVGKFHSELNFDFND